jgi:hypothetical protein
VFALLLVAVVAVTAGVALVLGDGSRPGSSPAPASVVGAIVAVDSRGLGDVRGFTLRVAGGDQLVFDLTRLENAVEFPPGHLVEHQATAEPVRVWFQEEDSSRFAIRIEDAGA